LRVEVGNELVEGGHNVTIVVVGTHGSGVGSNRSPDTRCKGPPRGEGFGYGGGAVARSWQHGRGRRRREREAAGVGER
jgi:hypothetical protein